MKEEINHWHNNALATIASARECSCAFTGHRSYKLPWKGNIL